MRRAYPDFSLTGYHWRVENGRFSLVHWSQVTDVSRPRGFALGFDEDPFPLEPIRKRTPQQRVDSLISRFGEDLKAGRVMTQDQLQDITANAWKRGQPVSGEAVRTVATALLETAERRQEAKQDKQVVRTAPSD